MDLVGHQHNVSVSCLVLVDQTGAVLAGQRPANKPLPGLWEFPGGKVEAGESPEDALRREILEELGFHVGDIEALAIVNHRYEFFTVELMAFFGRCTERPTLVRNEHASLAWVCARDLHTLDWAPADRPIVGRLERQL